MPTGGDDIVARTITIERDDDFELLAKLLRKKIRIYETQGPTTAPKHEIDAWRRLLATIEGKPAPKGAGVPSFTGKRTVETKDPTVHAHTLVVCGTHPKYTGQRKPRTGCRGCWAGYERLRKNAKAS